MSNQECKGRATADINSNEHFFVVMALLINKCSGSYNTVNDLFAQIWVSNVFKDIKYPI